MMYGYGYTVVVVIIVIIIIIVILAVACGGCGSWGSWGGCFDGFGCGTKKLPKCIKACRFCAEADSNQIQLGPCCIAKITNKVGQPTVYTLPDPGTGGAASFLLTNSTTGQTINGEGVVTSSGGSVTQLTSLTTGVTLDGSSGLITTVSGTPLLAPSASATFTVTNSSVVVGSNVLLSVTSGGSGGGLPGAFVSNVMNGSFDVTVYNASAVNPVNGTLGLSFLVLP